MKQILLILMLIVSASVHAQKLYLNDIQNGSYNSYDIGDDIELMLKDDSMRTYKGSITSFQRDGFTLNDTLKVKLANIFAVTKAGGGSYTVGRVLLMILGSYMILTGAVYAISGLVIAVVYPPLGVVVAIIGAGIGVGGYAIVSHQVKKAKDKKILIKRIDNIDYRLLLE
ncbi:MAG: hypothetical protein V4651_00720 [Bacteroidota bacterium]